VRTKETSLSITVESPSGAETAVADKSFQGGMLSKADLLVIDAALNGPTGDGAKLDVYLQRKLAADEWVDWIHFPQLSAGDAKRYTVAIDGAGSSIVAVGGGSDDTPAPALAAGEAVNVMPGGEVRIVFVAGEGTTAGAEQTITITPYTEAR